jgi:hypothetical protein
MGFAMRTTSERSERLLHAYVVGPTSGDRLISRPAIGLIAGPGVPRRARGTVRERKGVEQAPGFCLHRAAWESLIGRMASCSPACAGRAGRGEFLHRFRPPKRQRFGGGRKGGQRAIDGSATVIDGCRSVIDRSGNVIGRSNVAIDCKRLLPIPIIRRHGGPQREVYTDG